MQSTYFQSTIQPFLTREQGGYVPKCPLKEPIKGPLDREMDYRVDEWLTKGVEVYARKDARQRAGMGSAGAGSGVGPDGARIRALTALTERMGSVSGNDGGAGAGVCDYCREPPKDEMAEWCPVVIVNDLSDDMTRQKRDTEDESDTVKLCNRCFHELAFGQAKIRLSSFLNAKSAGNA